MGFDPFIIPFAAGTVFLLVYFFVKVIDWLRRLDPLDRRLFWRGILSRKSLYAVREVIMESLLHRKIFKTNIRLGYMHMSLAFGWFLLIIMGHFEVYAWSQGASFPPYYAIFFRFFEPNADNFHGAAWYGFWMDFLLFMILSGVFLAFYKRFRSKALGLKKTTNLQWYDKMALYSLWCIFPFRLFAESFTSGLHHNGSFMTGTLGAMMSSVLPLHVLEYPAWWAYSIALGVFFVALPFSRYMHIPTEVVLIFLRKYGIRTGKSYTPFSEIEVSSCSRCGICIDPCPMSSSANINTVQSVYFIRDIRYGAVDRSVLLNCLMCGRCSVACPVGIDTTALRMVRRREHAINTGQPYRYIPDTSIEPAKVLYFAGCMGHLTPSVTRAMEQIMKTAKERYTFMDRDGSICCGRPLMLAGRENEAKALMRKNVEIIRSSGARLLVTSCPICYKVFREDYHLNIEVLHHTQYIYRLYLQGRIKLQPIDSKMVYHDPCELGRGSGIYDEPRALLNQIVHLTSPEVEKEKSICCGGSLGNTILGIKERSKITRDSLLNLTVNEPDEIVTACPLCKKTFARQADRPVTDIAEVVAKSLQTTMAGYKRPVAPVEETILLPETASAEV